MMSAKFEDFDFKIVNMALLCLIKEDVIVMLN